jgi:tRNA(Ile)-lysidine synthase TilS/MesJ
MIKIIKSIVDKNQPYFFAVSSGVDSIAAYHFMRTKNYNVTPIHFNHKLRPQNDLMEQQYRLLCEATGMTPIVAYGNNLKTEQDCRQARLNFYKSFNGKILTPYQLG